MRNCEILFIYLLQLIFEFLNEYVWEFLSGFWITSKFMFALIEIFYISVYITILVYLLYVKAFAISIRGMGLMSPTPCNKPKINC